MLKNNIEKFLIISLISLTFLILNFGKVVAEYNLPEYDAKADDHLSMDVFMGCSLACAMTWDLKASSCLAPQKDNKYSVEMLNDGNFNTAWCEGAPGQGVGEWVEYHLKDYEGRKTKDIYFHGFSIANGYLKNEKTWRENSRVKQFRMDINGKPVCYFNLQDSRFNQHFGLPNTTVSPGDVIRLTITKVYPGDLYPDVCITELIPEGAH